MACNNNIINNNNNNNNSECTTDERWLANNNSKIPASKTLGRSPPNFSGFTAPSVPLSRNGSMAESNNNAPQQQKTRV